MKRNKLLAVLLALAMTLSLLPTAALAEGTSTAGADSVAYVTAGETTTYYTTLVEAVQAAPSGAVITLLKDCSGAGIGTFKSISGSVKDFTIDFAGHTYTCTGPAVGSSGTESQAFHLEWTGDGTSNANVTLQNGMLTSTADSGVRMLINNYCNLTVDRMALDGGHIGAGQYTLSNNCGTVTIKDTEIIASENGFAFDSCDYASYTGVTVTVQGNSIIRGKIELTNPNGGDNNAHIIINGGAFTDIPNAIEYAANNATIKLAEDVTLTSMITLNKSLTVDLNGHELARNDGNSIVKVINNATLTIDGTKTDSTVYGRINLGEADNNNGSAVLNGGTYSCTNGQTVLHINGTCNNSNVTISGASITSPTDNGIQLNGCGTFLIENSTITGATAVYIKSGTTTIRNCTLRGTMNPVDYTYNGNGANATGDAVVIDACNYPGGNPTVNFESGTFTGTKAAIGYYRYNSGTATISVTGGTFSTDPSAYKAEGTIVRVNDDNTYTVVTNSNLTSGTYLTVPSVASGYRYTGSEGAYVVSKIPSSSGGSSSGSSNTTTTTEKNPDGSTTTTTTNKTTGTVTETTKNTDGSTTTVETKKDGTVTETNKTADGTTGTVVTDKYGDVTEVQSTVSSSAAKEAAKTGEAVTLPVEVPAAASTEDAPAVDVTVPKSAGSVKVEIPVEKVTPGTVAVIVNADGTEEIVSTSVVTENGVALTLDGSATVKIIDNSKDFVDVPETNVFYNEISSLSAREIMIGKTEDTFDLYSSVTLNQIANVAGRITGAVDVKDFNAGIVWGGENGLKTGNVAATRGDVLKALYVAAGSPAVEDTAILARFSDSASISADMAAIVAWAAQNGILKGTVDGKADLGVNVTRGQACALAGRAMGVLA